MIEKIRVCVCVNFHRKCNVDVYVFLNCIENTNPQQLLHCIGFINTFCSAKIVSVYKTYKNNLLQ